MKRPPHTLDEMPLARIGQGSYERLLNPGETGFMEALTGTPGELSDADGNNDGVLCDPSPLKAAAGDPPGVAGGVSDPLELPQRVCCACGEMTVALCPDCQQPLCPTCRCTVCANRRYEESLAAEKRTAETARRPRRLTATLSGFDGLCLALVVLAILASGLLIFLANLRRGR